VHLLEAAGLRIASPKARKEIREMCHIVLTEGPAWRANGTGAGLGQSQPRRTRA
jgi:hypothetical protein